MNKTEANAVAQYLANWWTDRLESGDKDSFRAHLTKRVSETLMDGSNDFLDLEVDYDPRGLLLEAVRAAGLKCDGFMFSARGILPAKTETTVCPEYESKPARISIKEGYGNWLPDIPLSDIVSGKVVA